MEERQELVAARELHDAAANLHREVIRSIRANLDPTLQSYRFNEAQERFKMALSDAERYGVV